MFQITTTLLALGTLASATVMHVVTVGENGALAFCPEQITAAAGDLVQFQFYPKVPHLAFLFADIFRTTLSRKDSLHRAVHPSQKPQLVPHSRVYASARDIANIKAHFLDSCPFPQTQTPPPSLRSPSLSTAQARNGSIAPKPSIVSLEWCSPSTQPTQRLSTDTRRTAPAPPKISSLVKSALSLPNPPPRRHHQNHLSQLSLAPREHKRRSPFKLDRSPPHSPEQHHGQSSDSLVA
jgi:hypothetical protein